MTTLVDTSGLLALLDADADAHAAAAMVWETLLERDTPLVTTSYVVIECFALAQRRLGLAAARTLDQDFLGLIEVVWVDEDLHRSGVAALLTAARRQLSLVDCVSFELMRRRRIDRAFTLDRDFATQGFEVIPPTA